jgi:hypothetical protein
MAMIGRSAAQLFALQEASRGITAHDPPKNVAFRRLFPPLAGLERRQLMLDAEKTVAQLGVSGAKLSQKVNNRFHQELSGGS